MMPRHSTQGSERVAVFLPSMDIGGVQRVMLTLVSELSRRGLPVDLVLGSAHGGYLDRVPPEARVVDLQSKRVSGALPRLHAYLRRVRPTVLLSGPKHANVMAIAAVRMLRNRPRLVITEHSNMSSGAVHAKTLRAALVPWFMARSYRLADAIVSVSQGVADDLAATLDLDRSRMHVIHNPVVTPEMIRLSHEPVEHPWFAHDEIPVVVSVGRLTLAKDYPSLLKAFYGLRARRPARLVIVGEGEERGALEALIRELRLGDSVSLLGFQDNPYKYMRAAGVFVLSSQWEGFGNVIAEALACGSQVVSTDCKSGPSEILEDGKWGTLVPVGDPTRLTHAMDDILGRRVEYSGMETRSADFAVERIVDAYIRVMLPSSFGSKNG